MRRWPALIVFLLLVALTACSGVFFQPGAWYQGLTKPGFTPPNIAFPIAWTALYITMAVAAWRAWLQRGFDGAQWLWLIQLALNALWSWLVFGRHWLGAGALEIGVLWLTIAATTAAFFRRDRVAGALMLPYLAWVSFAGVLNIALWQLN
ncbi:TspO/MBR family protein [Oleiagrimonas sp. C23AA]|uniref:TspO/MBR family protein n=1 Tax=Oleiagrimonas sp. C23AA TaxID=2719047 RepID=UPI0014238553|nr:TspO/MBR family protein [Oleiagrimonas sp. C23AA]NII10235.1 tryptophan-rich sensory protein [Oleiagrimonas sp. C23AA]